MKKLIFDKVTKEIIVKEEKQKEKKIIQVKRFLEKYKIFFEIFSTTLIGIMSLIVSFVGWQTNQRSVDIYQKQLELQQAQLEIYQKQLEIETNDRVPHFTITCDKINEEDYSSKRHYIVKDEEGKINNGSIYNIDAMLDIHYNQNIYYCKINGAFFFGDSLLSNYDKNNKEFVFSGYDYFTYYYFENDLMKELQSIYGSENIYVTFNAYLTMHFTDYKNEEYERTYSFSPFNIKHVNYDYAEEKFFLGSMEFGEEISSIAYEIYKEIEDLQK